MNKKAEVPQLSADAKAEKAMHARAARVAGLPADGWGRLLPPQGKACWIKGDKYLDASGMPCDAPKPDAGVVLDEMVGQAHVMVDDMSPQDVAAMVMGSELTQAGLSVALDGKGDKKFIAQYSDDQVKQYLASVGVEVNKDMKRDALDQLVVSSVQ